MNEASEDDPIVQQAKSYKESAVTLYKSALKEGRSKQMLAFLDTTLILCTLEVWLYKAHLAYRLLVVNTYHSFWYPQWDPGGTI